MADFKFCPYCGTSLEGMEPTCWGDLECENCGELVIESNRTRRERLEYQDELVEQYEERQHQSGFYAFQDMIELYRQER